MRKVIACCALCFCSSFGIEARAMQDHTFNLFSLHANALSVGDLRMNRFKHGMWANVGYAKQSSDHTSFLQQSEIRSVLAQAGYDYAFRMKSGQSFLGFALDYSHSWIDSRAYEEELKSGGANTLALALYHVYMHQSNLYIRSSFKYALSLQDIEQDSMRSHLLMGNLELGYRANFARLFFFQPLVSVSGGWIPSSLNLGEYYPLWVRAGGYLGINFLGNLKGDLAFGGFLDSDFFWDSEHMIARKNLRLLLTLGSNMHINQHFRLFIGGKMEFFGSSRVDYGVNVGMRFMFGSKHTQKAPIQSNQRTLKDVQREMLYQSDLSRQRVQERTHLKPDELQSRYQMQDRRDSPYVQDDLKYAKRQRLIRESSRWIDTKINEQNYQNRNLPALQHRDLGDIKAYYQRELERKYGK